MVLSALGFRSRQGQRVVMGAAALGLGTLATYGSSCLAKEPDEGQVLDSAREGTRLPYVFLGRVFITAAITIAAILKSPIMTRFIERNGRGMSSGMMLVLVGIMLQEYPKTGSRGEMGTKLLQWLAFGTLLHSVAKSIQPPHLRVFIMWTGAALGLSIIGVCAPDKEFLKMGGPLGMILGLLFGGSMASMLVPPVPPGSCFLPTSLWGLLLFDLGLLACCFYYIQRTTQLTAKDFVPDPIRNVSCGYPFAYHYQYHLLAKYINATEEPRSN